MIDISDVPNHLNQEMQNDGVNIIEGSLKDSQRSPLSRVSHVRYRRLEQAMVMHFPTRELHPVWMRQPFTFCIVKANVNDEYLDKIIELQQS